MLHQETKPAIRRHRALNIRIRVYECDENDTQIRDFQTDIANGNKKDWIFNLILWATLNGKAIEIVNIIDDKD